MIFVLLLLGLAEATAKEKFVAVAEKDGIITFTATWCGPCRLQHAENDSLQRQGVKVTYVDVDRDSDLFSYVGGSVIPLTILVKKGKIVDRWVGVTNWHEIYKRFTQKE